MLGWEAMDLGWVYGMSQWWWLRAEWWGGADNTKLQESKTRADWLISSKMLGWSQLSTLWKRVVYTAGREPVPLCAVNASSAHKCPCHLGTETIQSRAHGTSPVRGLYYSLTLNLSKWTLISIKFICQHAYFHQAPNLNFPRTVSNSEKS